MRFTAVVRSSGKISLARLRHHSDGTSGIPDHYRAAPMKIATTHAALWQ